MLGYYRNPVETNKVCQNGWLHTGDMGRMDEDGYLYITGRKKNIIILANGDNVSSGRIGRQAVWMSIYIGMQSIWE